MKVSVCVPSVRAATIGATVRSVRAQTRSDWELLVVGQGDDAAVRAVVEREASADSRIRFLHVSTHGASAARNAALQAADGEILAMLDDDCEAAPDWLEVITGVLENEPGVGAVGGAVLRPPPRRRWPRRCPALAPAEELYDPVGTARTPPPGWDWIGSNFALRRCVAVRVGEFDEHLGPGTSFPAAEDADYKLRLEAHGVVVRSTPRAIVSHTSGWRYGYRAVMRHQANYARGGGALAGKLTLMGDPRGREWLDGMRAMYGGRMQQNPLRLAVALRGRHHYVTAYRRCLHAYRVNEHGLLVEVGGA